MNRNMIIKTILLINIFCFTLFAAPQTDPANVKLLHAEIDKLSKMVAQLKSEQANSDRLQSEIYAPTADYNRRDSLRLIQLRRKQAASRARIDQITLDILNISRQLEDPEKRYALAQRMKQSNQPAEPASPSKASPDSSQVLQDVSARSIDLAAVKLVRAGKTLDQARLMTIDSLRNEQVFTFYENLNKTERYELYDIADDIVRAEKVDLLQARRSAIYFYLFAK